MSFLFDHEAAKQTIILSILAPVLLSSAGRHSQAQEPDEPTPLHSELGIAGPIQVEGRGHYHRFFIRGILWRTQFNDKFALLQFGTRTPAPCFGAGE